MAGKRRHDWSDLPSVEDFAGSVRSLYRATCAACGCERIDEPTGPKGGYTRHYRYGGVNYGVGRVPPCPGRPEEKTP